jgi:CheY-like chemotaxis protein
LTPQPGIIRWPYGGIDAKDETMAIPVLLVVDDNPDSLKALDGVLRHRYGRDYLIISEASPGTALGRLRELRAAGRPVAVVMAAGAMTAAPGAEFLAQARGIQPGCRPRCTRPPKACPRCCSSVTPSAGRPAAAR